MNLDGVSWSQSAKLRRELDALREFIIFVRAGELMSAPIVAAIIFVGLVSLLRQFVVPVPYFFVICEEPEEDGVRFHCRQATDFHVPGKMMHWCRLVTSRWLARRTVCRYEHPSATCFSPSGMSGRELECKPIYPGEWGCWLRPPPLPSPYETLAPGG